MQRVGFRRTCTAPRGAARSPIRSSPECRRLSSIGEKDKRGYNVHRDDGEPARWVLNLQSVVRVGLKKARGFDKGSLR